MSSETNVVELTPRHQLIDLNKNLKNFKLEFNVKSLTNKDFDAVVMRQSELNDYDKLENIEMKNAPGKIGGTIIADNDKYENYFIILKSSEPNSVEISKVVEEIEPKEDIDEIEPEVEEDYKKPIYMNRGFWVLILIGLVLLGFYFKDFIFQKNNYSVGKETPSVSEGPSPVSQKPIIENSVTGNSMVSNEMRDPRVNVLNQGLNLMEE